jgi:prepilin-type N-terminal cleavage/methylation domain-containing protein
VSFLNSESVCIKKRTTKRSGFTLVEVIVVIVIIAILAAIGVPALTGYIDKAVWKEYEARLNDWRKAAQTMIIEQMSADNGNISLYTGGNASPGSWYFVTVRDRTLSESDPTKKIFGFVSLSAASGQAEMKKLTGTDGSMYGRLNELSATTDCTGAVKQVFLYYPDYFGSGSEYFLGVYWSDNFSSSDPYGAYITVAFPDMNQGFNAYKIKKDWSTMEKIS